MPKQSDAFTIIELLVSLAVLTVLVLLASRLFNSAAILTTSGNKRMDADAQLRPLFDRMTVDFSQMLKRVDLDYYLKSSANPQAGNDQMAFYSAVTGYHPSSGSQSPISVVSYRMVDVIAQSGRYPPTATGLDQFVVEGEKRYWLHIAIDRFTGEVIDQELEAVFE